MTRTLRLGLITLTLILVVIYLAAAPWLGPSAPARTFSVLELLVEEAVLPTGYSSYEPFSSYEFSCFECASIQFPKLSSGTVATMDAFRYLRAGIAHRLIREAQAGATFEYPEVPWTYQSTLADETYFGCYAWEAGESEPVCRWVGRYHEYLLVFGTVIGDNGMTLPELEIVIQAIEARVADYL